jgi:hypothetical protein
MLHSTRFVSPSTATATINVTIPATAAGAKLVVVAGGGATIQAKLGVGGTNFTKRTNSLSAREVVAQDIVDAGGGTTTIQIVLNGPENVDGMIFEFASGSLGNFIAGAAESSASSATSGSLGTNTVTTAGASVMFAMFTSTEGSSTPPAVNQLWGFEPLGKQFANGFIFPDTSKSTKYWSLIGVSDQASAGTFAAKSSIRTAGNPHQSVTWAYQDLTPGTPSYTNPYLNKIAEENSLPGQLRSTWGGVRNHATIAGYTDRMSYAPGSAVNFKVDSFNNAFNIEVYRIGFYNYAAFGGRLQATITGTPAAQSAPTINAYGGTVCAWSTTATWNIPATAAPGVYVYNMNRGGNLAQGIFVVRSTPLGSQANQIMISTADMTWQAYNPWGATTDAGVNITAYTGRSLYLDAPATSIAGRAFAVSYDRPFGTVGANSQSYFWDSEVSLVNFLEGNGYDLAYYSMVDLHGDSTIVSKYKIAISSGHSEYWTSNIRDAYEDGRDAGTNLYYVTSNTALWHTRFDPGDTNFRNMICYKDSHDVAGYDGSTKYDPVSYTGTWRDMRTTPGGVNNTDRRPETALCDQWFIGNGLFQDRFNVTATYSGLPIWRNTAVATPPTISVSGTSTASLTTAGTTLNINQPAGTLVGDLVVIAVTANGNASITMTPPFRTVRHTISSGPGGQTSAVFVGYALTAGAGAQPITFNTSRTASATMVSYTHAAWEDLDTSLLSDTGGTAAHTTRLIANDGSNRWAVCIFGDSNTNGTSKTTSWTASSGLTSRIQGNNAAAGAGPWCSSAIMDTNGAVTQGTHQYTATAQFANPQGFAGILYISPAWPVGPEKTVGAEWDYVKVEEPTTTTNLVRLSRQVIPLNGQASKYNGDTYGESGHFYYGYTLSQASSGALVFNSGSWRSHIGLSRFRLDDFLISDPIDIVTQQATVNILRDMGMAPTTLLNTTANLDATALVSPGSAASAASYGFPVAAPTVYQNIFGAIPPTSYDVSDGSDYSLGTLFTATSGGDIHGIRWHFPGVLPDQPVIGALYSWTNDTAGTQLATVTFANVQTGWNNAFFGSPVTITANAKYVAVVWTQDHYVTIPGQFTSAGVTSGSLASPIDAVGAHNGKFLTGAGAISYPSASFGSAGYLVDVMFEGNGVVNFEGWGFPIN